MAIPIPDERVDAPDRKIVRTGRKDPAGTIRDACENEFRLEGDTRPLSERLRPIIERYRALPDSGEMADKAFFDDLSGNL